MHGWPTSLSVVIPDTSLSTHENAADFTLRVGYMTRFMAMATVSRVIIYRENPGVDDPYGRRMELLLKFLVVPPYLRKALFPLNEDLRFAGLLPPINIPTHPQRKGLKVGDVRVALLSGHGKEALIDLNAKAQLDGGSFTMAPPGFPNLIFVRVTSLDPLRASACDYPGYPGFFVETTHSGLGQTLASLKGLKIGTSRYGEPYFRVLPQVLKELEREPRPTYLVFGSPSSDLHEILKAQGYSIKGIFDYYLNMDPDQVVKSIRTDEAVPLSLVTLHAVGSVLHHGK